MFRPPIVTIFMEVLFEGYITFNVKKFVLTYNAKFEYSETSRHKKAMSAWMASPYTQHMITQFSTNNFVSSLIVTYSVNILFKP
jgi:hypothetical protein